MPRQQRPRTGAAKTGAGGPWRAQSMAAAVLLVAPCTLLFVANVQEPYMDEIFHIPQAQRYCRGDMAAWDPKITTLPGLYYAALALLPALSATARAAEATLRVIGAAAPPPLPAPPALAEHTGLWGPRFECSARELRLMNAMLAVPTAAAAHRILEHVHGPAPADERWRLPMRVAVVILFPVQYFFFFLFYTDAVGTLMVLLTYERCLARNVWAASIFGAAAIMCRQTNAVWVVFCGGAVAIRRIQEASPSSLHASAGLMAHVRNGVRLLLSPLLLGIVRQVAPLITIVFAFLAFVVRNGGVAVGDKANHQAGLHPMQPAYWMLLVLGTMWPYLVSPSRIMRFLRALAASRVQAVAWLLLLLAGARYYTYAHPFLLADNRHYTFYLWKNVFRRVPAARYALAPVYMFGGWSCWVSTSRVCSPLWIAWFLFCSALVVVPTGLLEFRYFLVQTLLLLLHQPTYTQARAQEKKDADSSNARPATTALSVTASDLPWRLADEVSLVMYLFINASTIYIFVFRPFQWPDGSVARFMW